MKVVEIRQVAGGYYAQWREASFGQPQEIVFSRYEDLNAHLREVFGVREEEAAADEAEA